MRVPQLRKHATGQWFARWGGRDHYFGKDKAQAQSKYERSIQEWLTWRQSKRQARSDARDQARRTLNDIAETFLQAKRLENGGDCEARYERHLRRFRAIYGDIDCTTLKPKHLQLLKTKMIEHGYAPRTVNHDIGTIKTMYNWASALDLAPPISLVGVKEVPCGPVDNPSLDWPEFLHGFRRAPDYLQPWVALNYLGCLRPSETIKVVLGQGKWLKSNPGIFVLDRGKMDTRAAMRRHCILSPRALAWLQQAEPRYRRLDSYSQAVRDHCGFGPKAVQKTAATRLVLRHRANPDDVDLLLGHIKSRLSVTYFLPHFARLRQLAGRLAVR